MSDPFTPSTPNLGSDEAEADARDAGRRQDPAGALPEDRSFTGSSEADADADAARRFSGADGQDENDEADADGRQIPADHTPGTDMAESLGSNG